MIELQTAWNRPCRSLTGTESRVLLVKAVPRTSEAEPCDVCLLLDTSSSMEEEKLEAAKSACRILWERLREQDRLCLVGFATQPTVVLPWVAKNALHLPELQERLNKVSAHGVTLLGRALEEGARSLAEEPERARFLMVVTDGSPTNPLGQQVQDLGPLLQAANRLAADGVTVSAIGLGPAESFNAPFLTDLSDQGRGQFSYSREAAELAGILEKQLRMAQGATGTGARLQVTLSEGRLKWAARILPDYSPMDLPAPARSDDQAERERAGGQESATWDLPLGTITRPETDFLIELETEAAFGLPAGDRTIGRLVLTATERGTRRVSAEAVIALRFDPSLREQQRVNREVENLRLIAEMNRGQDLLRRGLPLDEAIGTADELARKARETGVLPMASLFQEQARSLRDEGRVAADTVARLTSDARKTRNLVDLLQDGKQERREGER